MRATWHTPPDTRSPARATWHAPPGARHPARGARTGNPIRGARYDAVVSCGVVSVVVRDTPYPPLSTLHPVCATRCVPAGGTWYAPPGTRHLVHATRCAPPGTHHPVRATRYAPRSTSHRARAPRLYVFVLYYIISIVTWYTPPRTHPLVRATRYPPPGTMFILNF